MKISSSKNEAPKEIQDNIRARVLLLKGVIDSIHTYKPIFTREEILFTLVESGFIEPMEYSLTEISLVTGTSITSLWRVQNEAMEKLENEHQEILHQKNRGKTKIQMKELGIKKFY